MNSNKTYSFSRNVVKGITYVALMVSFAIFCTHVFLYLDRDALGSNDTPHILVIIASFSAFSALHDLLRIHFSSSPSFWVSLKYTSILVLLGLFRFPNWSQFTDVVLVAAVANGILAALWFRFFCQRNR